MLSKDKILICLHLRLILGADFTISISYDTCIVLLAMRRCSQSDELHCHGSNVSCILGICRWTKVKEASQVFLLRLLLN